MFSEENIERTKERLVEYVKDNADDFEWKNVYSEGEYSGYWECKFKQLSDQPINNAMQVFGIDSTMDIIVETLEDFYNDYDEDDYGYDEDYHGFYDEDDSEDDDTLNQSANEPKDKNEFLSKLKELDDQISILQSMGFLSHAWRDDRDELEDSSEGLILSDVLNLDDVSFKDMDEFKKIIEANVEFDDEDDYDYRGENLLGNAAYEWFKQIGIKANDVTEPIVGFEDEKEDVSDKEMVNHPPHYNQGKFETIDIIEDIVSGYDDPVVAYLVGTTLKYLARAPFKNAEKQDLEKAEFYLKKAIDKLTNNSNSK